MSWSAWAPTTRSWLGWARSKPEPPVARSFEIMSSLLDLVTSTSMPVSALNISITFSGA
jgi:hypothetical protein